MKGCVSDLVDRYEVRLLDFSATSAWWC
jgi:hypothetical protein